MKRLLTNCLVAGLSFLVLSGCDDKKKYPDSLLPAHCSNGIQDNGEYAIDCGGECPSCGPINAPCQIDTNKVFFAAPLAVPYPSTTETVVMGLGTYDNTIGQYTVLGTTSAGDDFNIKFYGNKPTASRIYHLGGTPYLNSFYPEGAAVIHFGCLCGVAASSTSGTLYANILPNGKLMLSFCDAKFTDENFNVVVYNSIKGRVVCAN